MPPTTNTVTRDEAKWARQQLGWSQKRLVEKGAAANYEFSLSKLKAFEAGYLRPSKEFLQDLRGFLVAEGVDFADFAPSAPPAAESGEGNGGVAIARGRRSCFYLSSTLSEAEADKWFDAIERNQEQIRELCEITVGYESKDSPDHETQEHQHELLHLLALDSLMLRALIGSNPVEARPLGGKKARKLSDLLADFFERNLEADNDDSAGDDEDEEENAA
jgi:transcriptional regulator with XRE-family HTH domain